MAALETTASEKGVICASLKQNTFVNLICLIYLIMKNGHILVFSFCSFIGMYIPIAISNRGIWFSFTER